MAKPAIVTPWTSTRVNAENWVWMIKGMMMKTMLLAAGALAAASLTATAVLAEPQPRSDAPRAAAMERMMAMRGPMGHMGAPDPAAEAGQLRDLLQLRPEQDGALKTYIASLAPPEHEAGPGRDHPDFAAMTTPERLDFLAARMAEHADQFKLRAEATKRFYAVLSPAQRKAFEAAHLGEGPMGGMHGGMGGMRIERHIERFGSPGDMPPPEMMGPPPEGDAPPPPAR
jgi:hypothetical protein